MNTALLDKFQGCILGLAIGDALGSPIEFLAPVQRKRLYGPRGVFEYPTKDGVQTGRYTDDTQMSLAIAEALIKSKSFAVDEIMKNIVQEFIKWKNSPDNDRAPGNTCLNGIANLEKGMNWKKSGLESKGCGAAMRTAPIGLLFNDNLAKLKEIATASAICTHNHPTAIASAVGNAYLVSKAVNGEKPDVKSLVQFTKGISDEFTAKIIQIEEVDSLRPEQALNAIGQGWTGHEAVALALYCNIKNDLDFEKTVLMAVNTNGDSDSIACIAGGIAGAYQGYEKIPKRFLEGLENKEYLLSTAKRLFEKVK